MGRAKGTTSAGRRKIEMRRIESDERRQVTFSKRRAGLFKKASELATLCGAEVAVVVFSRAGRAFCFGSPSVDRVADRFLLSQDGAAGGGYRDDAAAGGDDGSLAEMRRCTEELRAEVVAEQARVEAVGAAVARAQGGRKFWWEADVEAIGEGELWEFERALTRLRANVERRADALLSTPPLC